VKKEVIDIP